MAFLAMISMESEINALKVSILKTADPVKEKVFFCYYRLAKGISGILGKYHVLFSDAWNHAFIAEFVC